MRPTLKTIAAKAGVSPTTVSLCLNRHPVAETLAAETRNRIFEIAKECNYRPSFIAKALSLGKTNSIGLVVADLKIERQANFASEIMTLAKEKAYHLLIASTRYSKAEELEALLSLKERQVDGIIFQFDSLSPETDIYQQCKKEKFPIVKLCPDDYFAHVIPDCSHAMRQALARLQELGAKRLCGIIAPIAYEENHAIFEQCCREQGIDYDIILPDCGKQANSYSDELLAKVARRDDCHFVNLGAYNLFRLQKLIKKEKQLVTFLDEYDPVMELNDELIIGIIFSNFQRILAKAVELLLQQIAEPEKCLKRRHTIKKSFITLAEFRKRVDYNKKLRERFF